MKAVVSMVLACITATAVSLTLAQSTPMEKSLPYGDCMRLDNINEWHVVDSRTAIVRTGPYQRYLVKLQADCPKLGIGNAGLRFSLSEADKATPPGRICGGVGEKVWSRIQPACAIQSVSLIDEPTFDSYRNKAIRHSVRSQQPSKKP